MKARNWVPVFALAMAAAANTACSGSSQQLADESTSTTEQAQILGTAGNIIAWPAGPIAWNGMLGTWPISVWSTGTIGALAFNVAGVNDLGITALGFPGLVAAPITTGWLGAFTPAVGTAGLLGAPFFGTAGLVAPSFGFTGAFNPAWTGGFGFGAFGAGGALTGTWANGVLGAGWGLDWLTPTLTSSALMMSNLAALNTLTPYTFNVTFQAQTAAQAAAINTATLSIFATPALTAAATIPFTSMAFPIMPLPIAAAAPLAAPLL
jgi:hypothetical protein